MAVKIGDTVEYILSVTSPANQAGMVGEKKIVGNEMDLGVAKRLLNGPDVCLRIVPPVQKIASKAKDPVSEKKPVLE